MVTNQEIVQEFRKLFRLQASEVTSQKVRHNAFRLDASSYSERALSFQKFLNKNGQKSMSLSSCAKIVGLGPFKRTYIQDPSLGLPLLSSSEIMELDPSPNIMAKVDSPKWSQYQVKEGWIVVSCSGTIGNVAIVPQKWNEWGISQHAIRIIPSNGLRGFIYAYLNLPFVKEQIIGMKSGSVIDEVYEEDIERIQVPTLNSRIIHLLDNKIDVVIQMRKEAVELLEEANSLIHSVNGLQKLNKNEVEILDVDNCIDIFLTNFMTIRQANGIGSEIRLDAHFYNPLARLAMKNIKGCGVVVKSLINLTERIFFGNRSKRNYVELDRGIPFLSGKNIIQIRPELKYTSRSQTENIQELLLERDWILVTRSGTIGRTCFVWKNYENYAASEHIIRIVPKKNKIDPGYLYAFLATEYGYEQILRHRHGSVIDEITDSQLGQVLVPIPTEKEQKRIGDKVRAAFEKRADAIRLEDEAQQILMNALTGK